MADSKEARVPDIGDFDAVPVIEVLVSEGDHVDKDQGLVTLESDKATMEVPSPFAGTVRSVKVKTGDEVSEGDLIAMIEPDEGGEGAKEAEKEEPEKEAREKQGPEKEKEKEKAPKPLEESAKAQAQKRERGESGKSGAGEDEGGGKEGGDDLRERPQRHDVDPEAAGPSAPPVSFDAERVLPEKVPYASPAVRMFARELGVDLGKVTGSGRNGRIVREDVQGYVKKMLSGQATLGTAAAGGGGGGLNLLPWPKVDFSRFGEVEEKPLSRIRKISGANLARNWAMIPHVTHHDEADITAMEDFRKRMGEEHKDVKVTPLVFLIKAAVAALKKFPHFNASLDPSGETLVHKKYFHIGIAVDTPDGLVVPVIRDCDRKGLIELSKELADISAKARDKKLAPGDMQGGCFSISSLGGIGGTGFTPIVNAPEVAILGVCRSSMKPVWDGDGFEPRLVLPLSLSYDHRVVDGADAARFTRHLAQVLGDLRRLLL